MCILFKSAIHPSEVGKWVVIHVIRYRITGWRPSVVGRGVVYLLAASACPESVTWAMGAAPGYYSQCRSDTTSTVVKRRWHMLRMLSGAIPIPGFNLLNMTKFYYSQQHIYRRLVYHTIYSANGSEQRQPSSRSLRIRFFSMYGDMSSSKGNEKCVFTFSFIIVNMLKVYRIVLKHRIIGSFLKQALTTRWQ